MLVGSRQWAVNAMQCITEVESTNLPPTHPPPTTYCPLPTPFHRVFYPFPKTLPKDFIMAFSYHFLLTPFFAFCYFSLSLLCAPVHAQFTTIIDIDDPTDVAPASIGSNTQLNLSADGFIHDFDAGAVDGSSTDVEVNISGGVLDGFQFTANAGSTINISGGTVMPIVFAAKEGSTLNIFGGDFLVNDQVVSGLDEVGNRVQIDLTEGRTIGGTLADGRPFVLPLARYVTMFEPGALVFLESAPLSGPTPQTFVASKDELPSWLRRGQKLVVDSGASVPDGFLLGVGSHVVFEEGSSLARESSSSVQGVEAIGATIDIQGGDRISINANNGSQVTVTGGEVGGYATSGSSFDFSGGKLFRTTVGQDATLTISGGIVGASQTPGGDRMGRVVLREGGELHLLGTEFTLRGAPIVGLSAPGDSVIINERGFTNGPSLRGTLLDGETFRFDLATHFSSLSSFDPNGTLRLTFVPEPSTLALCMLLAIPVCYSRQLGRSFR